MGVVETGLGLTLSGLRRLGGLDVVDRLGQRDRLERVVRTVARTGAASGLAVARQFGRAGRVLSRPARQQPRSGPPLFDLAPTDEQAMLVDAFGAFARDRLRPAARAADDDCAAPKELLATANQLGALVLGIPAELGGVVDERAAVTSVLVAEALATGDLGLAAAVLAPAAVATTLALHADAEQQSRYLPAFASDEPPAASLAVMEPRALFDPTRLATVARRDGGDLVVDGAKATVLRGADAELFLVAVDLDGRPALVLVESTAPGLSFREVPTLGARAGGAGTLSLRGVRVPRAALLAEGDPAVVADVVARARIAWGALACGTARAVLDHVVPYVKERRAFGEPIAHRQAVAFMVADIAVELDGLRLATLRAAGRADDGSPFAREAALVRRLTHRHATRIGSDGVQLLGGHGYVKEHPVERWYRDLRTAGIVEGGLAV